MCPHLTAEWTPVGNLVHSGFNFLLPPILPGLKLAAFPSGLQGGEKHRKEIFSDYMYVHVSNSLLAFYM